MGENQKKNPLILIRVAKWLNQGGQKVEKYRQCPIWKKFQK
jgi:hypothetical protein